MTEINDTPTVPVAVLDDPRNEVDVQSEDRPLRRSRMTREEYTDLAAAFLTGAAGAGLLRTVFGWHGLIGTGVWWYLLFIAAYYLLQRDAASNEVGLDRVVTVVIWSVGIAVVAVLAWMIGFVVVRGYHKLSAGFFVHDMRGVGPLNPGGGVRAAIIGSAEQVGLATLAVVPLAVLTAVYLQELGGRLARLVRFTINALAGFPSIVAGLTVYTVWVEAGHGPSGAAGAAALAILMLPFVTRTAEEVLRTVPDSLREASLALGAPQWRVVMRVVLPTALAGLTTAAILGVAIGVGETAPLLFTTSYSDLTVWNPFHGPQSSLAYYVYTYVLEPNKTQNQRGFTALLILVILVLVLFVLARLAGRRNQRRLGRSR